MVFMALSWAVQEGNAGLESYPGKQTVAQFGCSKTTTSLPWWFDSVSAVAFLVEELYCVEPPPHPSSNDVDMPWRQFGWHVFPPPCWEHHRFVAKQIGQRKSLPLQYTLQIDKPHLCLSTALSRIPGFHFWKKEQVGVLVTPENPQCVSKWKWVLQDQRGPWIPLSPNIICYMYMKRALWQKWWPHCYRLLLLIFKAKFRSDVSDAMTWNNVCLRKLGNCWLKKRKISFRYFIIQKTWFSNELFPSTLVLQPLIIIELKEKKSAGKELKGKPIKIKKKKQFPKNRYSLISNFLLFFELFFAVTKTFSDLIVLLKDSCTE